MKNRYHYILRTLAALTISAAFTACTQDDLVDGDGAHKLTYRLQLSAPGMTQPSRSDAINAKVNEQMKSWVVIVAKDGKIEDILEKSLDSEQAEDLVTSFSVVPGYRTFYNFANVDKATVLALFKEAGYTANDFILEAPLPPMENLKALGFPVAGTGKIPGETETSFSIPMTNIESHFVDNNMTVTLQVYRILSRVRFSITNKYGKAVTIRKITMGDITLDDTPEKPSEIFFFPPQMATTEVETSFPAGKHAAGDYTFYLDETNPYKIRPEASHDFEYYISPSMPNTHPTKHFPIWIEMKDESGTEYRERFAVTSIDNIRRNWIVTFPIFLTGYEMELHAYHYAPIGGYPEVVITRKNDTEFNCDFKGSGDFALRPYIYKYEDTSDHEKWFELNDKRYIVSKSLKVEDPNGIFSVEPDFNAGNEIIGRLNGTTGTATVKLTVELRVSETVTQTFVRTFYVIHTPE